MGREREALGYGGPGLFGRESLDSNFPGKQLQPVSELVGKRLSVNSASGEELNFEGWISLQVKDSLSSGSVSVPFLITKMELETPILGYTVIADFNIEELLLIFKNQEHKDVQIVDQFSQMNKMVTWGK